MSWHLLGETKTHKVYVNRPEDICNKATLLRQCAAVYREHLRGAKTGMGRQWPLFGQGQVRVVVK